MSGVRRIRTTILPSTVFEGTDPIFQKFLQGVSRLNAWAAIHHTDFISSKSPLATIRSRYVSSLLQRHLTAHVWYGIGPRILRIGTPLTLDTQFNRTFLFPTAKGIPTRVSFS